MSRLRTFLSTAAAAGILVLACPSAASAVDGTISYIEAEGDGVEILVSVPPNAFVNLGGAELTVNGEAVDAEAVPADTDTRVRRTTVLTIDTSDSMAGPRFEAAKQAALAYLDAVPDDVYVGIVSFDATVTSALAPSLDRNEARAVVNSLSLSQQTLLYDAVLAAVEMAGTEGQRTLLVLSDGADTGDTPITEVISAISETEIMVDVVALEQSGANLTSLTQLTDAGAVAGEVISADSEALTAAFSDEAEVLARQVLVTAQLPAGMVGSQATVAVSLPSSAGPVTAAATIPGSSDSAETITGPLIPERGWTAPDWVMYAGVGVFGAGLITAMVLLVPDRSVPMSAADRVATYTSGSSPGTTPAATKSEPDQAMAQIKEAAAGVLERSKSLDQRITHRLEGAGSELKSSEWLLLHGAIVVGSGMVGLLAGQGNLIVGLIFILLGAVGPWIYLGFRKSRRRKAFNAALPDTLQLMSGSLSAGLSLSQSVDTITRQGADPVASEFKRVLVETRLGVPLEDAFEGVAERFDSKDFAWVVMAIRIQRQVGGNLAELLDTVGATMREREYLRRQVNALAAEGKLSAWVLGVLPPGFLLYLVIAQRDYVSIMFTDVRGIVMMIAGGLWLGVGVFWMSRLIKVEV